MPSLDAFSFRPFDPANDLVRLFKLRNEVEHFDQEGIPVTLEALKAGLQVPGHDPVRDRLLAVKKENPSLVIGYSAIWPSVEDADLQIIVHPAYRRLGIGAGLLRRNLVHARELSTRQVNAYASGKNAAANAFLMATGFIRKGAYTELRALAHADLPQADFPPGFTIKPYSEVNDQAALTNAMTDCYAGLCGHHVASDAQMTEWLPTFDLKNLLMLFDAQNTCVGISRTELNKERSDQNGKLTGYIDAPGLVPALRRQALYHALLLYAVHGLMHQSAEIIEMESWGDDPALLTSYGKFGFQPIRSLITYQQNLD